MPSRRARVAPIFVPHSPYSHGRFLTAVGQPLFVNTPSRDIVVYSAFFERFQRLRLVEIYTCVLVIVPSKTSDHEDRSALSVGALAKAFSWLPPDWSMLALGLLFSGWQRVPGPLLGGLRQGRRVVLGGGWRGLAAVGLCRWLAFHRRGGGGRQASETEKLCIS